MEVTMAKFDALTAREIQRALEMGQQLEAKLKNKIEVNIKIHGTMLGLLKTLTPRPPGSTHDCIYHLLIRAIKSCRAVTINVLEGLEEDANNAMRSMIDHVFTAGYILGDEREGDANMLATRYIRYEAIERWRSYVRLEEMRGAEAHPIPADIRQELDRKQKAFVKDFIGEKATYKNVRSWHNMGMKTLSLENPANFRTFHFAYQFMCMSSHPSWVTKRMSSDWSSPDVPADAFPRCHDDSILWMPSALLLLLTAEYCERYFSERSDLKDIVSIMFELLHNTQPVLMAQFKATKSGYLKRQVVASTKSL